MRVRNVVETVNEGCRCGSWLEHWNTFSRQRANFCMVIGCDGKPEVGGQVQKEGEPGKVYVVPLCKACAAKAGQELDIVSTVNLVSALTEDTCARKHANAS